LIFFTRSRARTYRSMGVVGRQGSREAASFKRKRH
jgi:hypothetical protein